MPQELFNQTLITTISDNSRIATGIPSQVGCDNTIFSVFKDLVNGVGKLLNQTGAIVLVQPANSRIRDVFIEKVSGNPTVKIGTAAGLEDLSPLQNVGNDDTAVEWGGGKTTALRNLYITITDNVNIRYKLETNYI
jgi:hypothetical protein